MQLGFVSAIFPDLALRQVLEYAAWAGFECVELMCWPKGRAERRYAGVTHVDAANLGASQAEEVRQLLRNTGITISGLGYYPNPLSPNPDEARVAVEQIRHVIVAAEQIEVNVVNTFIGRDWTRSVEENWPRFVATWPSLIRFAEQHGVRIGIENCPMLFTQDEWPGGKNLATCPAIWRRMFEAIPSESFGLNFDPSHLLWQGMDYVAAIRQFAPRLVQVHAKDARLDRETLNEVGLLAYPSLYHTPKLPGLGDIDWGHFFSALSDSGYDGAVCIEVEDRAYEGSLQRRQDGLEQSARYLRQYMS